MSRDLPILFQPPMVRAILREIEQPGTGKTQTRRVLKLPTKTFSGGPIYERPDMGGWAATTSGGGGCFTVSRGGERIPEPERPALWHQTTGVCIVAPHAVGDRLYVRETWGAPDADHPRAPGGRKPQPGDRIVYLANPADAGQWQPGHPGCADFCWRPSIHMPRWASRITLTVTDVRVERLQDISRDDAIAEGLSLVSDNIEQFWRWPEPHHEQLWLSPVAAYQALWDSINAARGYGWNANPWVVAYSFRPVLANIEALDAEAA